MKRLPSHGFTNDKSVHYGLRNYPPGMAPSDDFHRSLFFNSLHKTSSSSKPSVSKSLSFEAYVKKENSSRHLQLSAKTLLTSSNSVPRQEADPIPQRLRDVLGLTDDEEFEFTPKCTKDPDVSQLQARLFALQFNPDRERELLPPGDYDARLYNELTPDSIKQATITFDENGYESVEPIDTTNATFELLANARAIECECDALVSASSQSTVVCEDQLLVDNSTCGKLDTASEDSAYYSTISTVGKRLRSVGLSYRRLHLGVISHYPRVVFARRANRIVNATRLRRRLHRGVGVHQLFKMKSVRASRLIRFSRRAKMTFLCGYEEEQTQ